MTGNAVDDDCDWRAGMAAAADDCMAVEECESESGKQEE